MVAGFTISLPGWVKYTPRLEVILREVIFNIPFLGMIYHVDFLHTHHSPEIQPFNGSKNLRGGSHLLWKKPKIKLHFLFGSAPLQYSGFSPLLISFQNHFCSGFWHPYKELCLPPWFHALKHICGSKYRFAHLLCKKCQN